MTHVAHRRKSKGKPSPTCWQRALMNGFLVVDVIDVRENIPYVLSPTLT